MATARLTSGLRWASPQRNFLFEVVLPEVSGDTDARKVSHLVMEAKVGDYHLVDLVTMRYGPAQRHYAGAFKLDGFQLTFVRPEIKDLLSAYLYAWRKLICDGEFYFAKNNYAKLVQVNFLDQAGEQINSTLKLLGSFPKSPPDYSLSMQTDAVPVYSSIPFACDRAELYDAAGVLVARFN